VVIWALAAWAAEPAVERDVIVYGELLVEQARQEVVDALAREGYDIVLDRGDHTIYRHANAWEGDVVLYDDGWMLIKRQPIRFEGREMPWAERNSPLAWAGCVIYSPLCLRMGGASVGQRKWRAVETRTAQAAEVRVHTWSERVADLHTSEVVDGLPDRLQALWDDGVPLEGTVRLGTPEARRAALLDYWGTRTDSPWGEAVRGAVESFCRAVVQRSDTPFTVDEIARFNATTTADRPFDLSPPPDP
jgi:hypothetical protein